MTFLLAFIISVYTTGDISDFSGFVSKNYIALPKGSEALVEKTFGKVRFIVSEECAFITEPLTEAQVEEKLNAVCASSLLLSRIRLL